MWHDTVQSKVFPPNIWFYLTVPSWEGGADMLSKRDALMKEIESYGMLGKKDSKRYKERVQLFFGNGGKYDLDLLTDRINMLEMLETKVNFLKYDLKRLQQEVILKEE